MFFYECSECAGRLFLRGVELGRNGSFTVFACDTGCVGGEVADVDVQLEVGESLVRAVDVSGRMAMAIIGEGE